MVDEGNEPVSSVTIASLHALEILDSRGRPTLEVTLVLSDGSTGTAGVPSGVSTGTREAVELRDGDPRRYLGLGVTTAVDNVEGPLADAVCGQHFPTLGDFDAALIAVDGTPTKSRLGANALVGASMAAARAYAQAAGRQLWEVLSPAQARLPVPHFNVVNGGAHAPNPLAFQEFMIAPFGARNMPDAIRAGAEVYAALRRLLASRGMSTGLGDEGGFAPDIDSPEEALTVIVQAIRAAGYPPGRDGVAIALDPAANGFFRGDGYQVGGQALSSDELITHYEQLATDFPIWSIEDGLAEQDRAGWTAMTDRLGDRLQIVGDDIFVTDATTIVEASREGIANAALIKLNQIGTVSETLAALAACRDIGYGAMVSHRSGETPDDFIADLAVASGCGQLKAGAPARGERVAKYNRLLAIAARDPLLPIGVP
jgi:enolase